MAVFPQAFSCPAVKPYTCLDMNSTQSCKVLRYKNLKFTPSQHLVGELITTSLLWHQGELGCAGWEKLKWYRSRLQGEAPASVGGPHSIYCAFTRKEEQSAFREILKLGKKVSSEKCRCFPEGRAATELR